MSKIICPNLSLPDVAREFNELKDAVGEVAAYQMWSENNGNGVDSAPSGAKSVLFSDLLNTGIDRIQAIKVKSKAFSKSFRKKFGDWVNGKSPNILMKGGEPNIQFLSNYAQDREYQPHISIYDPELYSEIIKQVIKDGIPSSGIEVFKILKSFVSDTDSAVIDHIIKHLQKRGDISIYKLPFINKEGDYVTDGFYRNYDGIKRVFINTNARNIYKTLVHEYVHSISEDILNNNSKLQEQLEAVTASALNQYMIQLGINREQALKRHSGFKDGSEFIAEFFSNRDFRQAVLQLDGISDIINKISTLTSNELFSDGILGKAEQMLFNIFEKQYVLNTDLNTTAFNRVSSVTTYSDKIDVVDELDLEINAIAEQSRSNNQLINELNSFNKDLENYIKSGIISRYRNEGFNIVEEVHNLKMQYIQERQKEILKDTQLQLMANHGITRNEDGTYSGNDVVVQFLEYIDEAAGYYESSEISQLGHNTIALSLAEASPETFNHELAHHYVRMFWNTKLIQSALAAVYKKGMTEEQLEEALVEVITKRTKSAKELSALQDNTFFHKFWHKFAQMLYDAFKIKNQTVRNAVLNNVSKAFFYNEQLKRQQMSKNIYDMAKQRMYQRTKYQKLTSISRAQARQNKVAINYQAIQNDATQQALSTMIKGSVARNKSYRKGYQFDPKTLVAMQLQEDEARKFTEDIQNYREQYKQQLGKNRLSAKEKYDMSHTSQEINRNKKMMLQFVENAKQQLFDLSEKLVSMESSGYSYFITREVTNPSTGESYVEYLDSSHINDADVQVQQVTFDELQDIRQNTIGFYKNVFAELKNAVSSAEFKNTYGRDFKDEMQQALYGTSLNSQYTAEVGINDLLNNIELLYSNAILDSIMRFVHKYIDENVQLNDELKERLKYSIRTWLEDQNTFGDIGVLETWAGLTSNSKSPLIRLLGDVIDNMSEEKNRVVKEKAEQLKTLRDKARNRMSILGIPITNLDKMFMERDDDGFDGNFISEINEGKYYKDKQKFIDKLLFGKNGVEQQVRDRIGDSNFDLEIDESGQPVFPNGCDDIENQYLHDVNYWISKHAIRQFTKEYYDARIDMLSSVTRKKLSDINSDINRIIKACTVDGEVRTDLLPSPKQKELLRLYRAKSQMSNPFDLNGRLKQEGTEEYQIAKELTDWAEFTKDKIKYTIDQEAYDKAYNNAKDKKQFEFDNTYDVVNPVIWEAAKSIFTKATNDQLDNLRRDRRKLISIIQLRGMTFPNIDMVWDDVNGQIRPEYADFWINLKKFDEDIAKLQKQVNASKMSKAQYSQYQQLLQSISIPYNRAQDGVNISWYTHIEQQITNRINQQYPNDPTAKQRIQDELNQFRYVVRDPSGNSVSNNILSVFTMTAPPGTKVVVNGKFVNAIVKQPIQAYSKIDMGQSDPTWVDSRFDQTSGKEQQPLQDKHNVTDGSGKLISYTNKDYERNIKNAHPDIKAYYDALIETMRDAYESIPFTGKYDLRLPQIGANTTQMFYRANIFKTIGYYFKRNWWMPNESDVDINRDYELRPDGSRAMNIPLRYIKRLEDPSQINSDVFGSVIEFYEMTQNFHIKIKNLPVFQTILDKLQSNNSNNVRQRQMLKGMINRQFYDKLTTFDTDEDNKTVHNSVLSRWALKLLPAIKGLTQLGLLGFGWIPGLVSYLDPAINLDIEAIQGKYFDWRDWIVGHYNVITNLGNAVRGAGSTRTYGKLTGIMSRYGIHNTGAQQYKNSNMNQATRLLYSGVSMWPFSIGEYAINARTTATMMHSYRYFNGKYYNKRQFVQMMTESGAMSAREAKTYFNGSDMAKHTLYEAYEVDKKTGAVKPKNNIYGQAITKEFEVDFSKRIKNRIASFILKVPVTEKTKIQSQVLVSFIMVMRTFMLPGLGDKFKIQRDFQIDDDSIIPEENRTQEKSRLKQEYADIKGGYNFQTQEIENGVTAAVFATMFGKPIRLLKYLKFALSNPTLGRYSNEAADKRSKLGLSDTDMYAVGKFATEMLVIALLSLASVLWHNKIVDDDKEDTYTEAFADLVLMRLTIERLTWINPGTITDLVNSITPSKTDFDRKFKIIDLIQDLNTGINEHGISNYDEWDKVKSGAYKGQTKVFKDLLQTMSSTGAHNLYTTSSTQGLKSKLKWYNTLWTPAKPFYHKKETKNKKPSGQMWRNGANPV